MAVLHGEQDSFMHDLESFFWVLLWICIHYSGSGESRVLPEFNKWNYADSKELAWMKTGIVVNEGGFLKMEEDSLTSYFQILIP